MIVPKSAEKQPFFDTKSDVELARRLRTAQKLFVVMSNPSLVILSDLDAAFDQDCVVARTF